MARKPTRLEESAKAVWNVDRNGLVAAQGAVDVSTTDVSVPPANVAAIVAYPAAGEGVRNILGGVGWSYDDNPTGGNIQIQSANDVIFNLDITNAGPGFFLFIPPKRGGLNSTMTITLAAGGAGISGKLSVLSHWTE